MFSDKKEGSGSKLVKQPANLSGALQKSEKAGLGKKWKPRYVSQKGSLITIFASEYEQTADKIIATFDLRDISAPTSLPKVKNAFVVTAFSSNNKEKTEHTFLADTPELYLKWVAGFSDWVSFLQKNPSWGSQNDASDQPLLSSMTQEELQKLQAEVTVKINNLTSSMAGLEKLIGFCANDPTTQQQTHLQLEGLRKDMNELLQTQRQIGILLSGDPSQREEIYRADLQVVEGKLKKNLANFDALDKMAQHLPPGSSQLAGAQNELRVLSELLARLESQKQQLNKSIEELGGSAPSASGAVAYAEALYDFESTAPGELELRAGDAIIVTEMIDENWWAGSTLDGRQGIFPVSYVVEKQKPNIAPPQTPKPPPTPAPTPAFVPPSNPVPTPPTPKPAPTPTSAPAPELQKAKALYPFEAQTAVELELAEGDIISLSFAVQGEEWWRGSLANGREGVFPASYVELMPSAPSPVKTSPAPTTKSYVAPTPTPTPTPTLTPPAPPPTPAPQPPLLQATMPTSPPTNNPAPGRRALPVPRQLPKPQPKSQPPQRQQPPPPQRQPPHPQRQQLPPQPPPQPKQVTAVAMYDFVPESPQELELRAGDVITLTQPPVGGEEWLSGQLASGAYGAFPASYVKLQ